jgi:hypothetical protein
MNVQAKKQVAALNDYESAFESFMRENRIKYTPVDQTKRTAFSKGKIKTFDFFIYKSSDTCLLVEVKGRKFRGTSLLTSTLDCWVTADDVKGLSNWQNVFDTVNPHVTFKAVFAFAFKVEKIDIETDGKDLYQFDGQRYIFYIISLNDYKSNMRLRSTKWQTLTLASNCFRKIACNAQEYLLSF